MRAVRHATSDLRSGERPFSISSCMVEVANAIAVTAARRDWGDLAADLGAMGLTAGEAALSITYAAPRVARTAAAVYVQRLEANYIGNVTRTIALDAGLNTAISSSVTAGVAMLHVCHGFGHGIDKNPLQTRLRVGMAARFRARSFIAVASADGSFAFRADERRIFYAGLEVAHQISKEVTIVARGGLPDLSDSLVPHFGAGFAFGRVRVDLSQSAGTGFQGRSAASVALNW